MRNCRRELDHVCALLCSVLPTSQTERSALSAKLLYELFSNPVTIAPIWSIIEYHLFKYKISASCILKRIKQYRVSLSFRGLVRCLCMSIHASKLGSTDLRWKDFLSYSNPHRQLGPYDYSRPLLSTHLFECRAFLIHPKKGFQRGLYRWLKLKGEHVRPLGPMSNICESMDACTVHSIGLNL